MLWTTGNPCPDYNGDERRGDNLWSNSVVSLDPETGRMRWYFQFTPHDLNDWDAVQTVIAVDAQFEGKPRRLLLQANRNGFFYVLDRETGKPLRATPFSRTLNWATGIDTNGRPQRIAGMEPSVRGTVVCPSVEGATNWMSPAYNPDTGLYYVQALERCSVFQKSSRGFEPGESFYGGSTRRVPGETGGKCCAPSTSTPAASPGNCRRSGRAIHGAASCRRPPAWSSRARTTGRSARWMRVMGAGSGSSPANAAWRASPMTYTARGRQHVADRRRRSHLRVRAGGTVSAHEPRCRSDAERRQDCEPNLTVDRSAAAEGVTPKPKAVR